METQTTRDCPNCGTTLPVLDGYMTWCHSCGWNVAAPLHNERAAGRMGRAYQTAGRRLGSQLAQELTEADRLEPRWTPAKVAAFAIAGLFYAGVIAAAVVGAALIALAPTNPAAIVAGVLLIAIALLVRPRFGKVPDHGVLEPDETPHLYALTDEVASSLDSKRVDAIVVTPEYNASFAILSLRRRRVLRLGLPLFTALEPQERVALVAHELAHGRNGDSTRGFVVGSALNGLAEIYNVLMPRAHEKDFDELAVFGWIANAFMRLLALPFWLLFYTELHLLQRDSQRAEYLADALAAQTAGTTAVISLHEKLLLESSFDGLVHEHLHARSESDLFAEVRTRLAAVPDRERERQRRVARLEESRLSDSHPPTAMRIRLLEDRPQLEANVTLTADESDTVDRELTPWRRAVQTHLVDAYRDALYA